MAGGELLAIDLRLLASNEKELAEIARLWEKLADSENRPEMEERLLRGINEAAQRVFAHHNPLLWMRSLPFAHELIQEPASTTT